MEEKLRREHDDLIRENERKSKADENSGSDQEDDIAPPPPPPKAINEDILAAADNDDETCDDHSCDFLATEHWHIICFDRFPVKDDREDEADSWVRGAADECHGCTNGGDDD